MKLLWSLAVVYALCTGVSAQTSISVLKAKKFPGTEVRLFTDTAGWEYKNISKPSSLISYANIADGTYYQHFLHDTGRVSAELVYAGRYLVSYKTYWINDSLQTECRLVDGKIQGNWVSYDSSGHKIAEYIYPNADGMHSEFTIYFPNGKVKRHAVTYGRKKADYLWEIEDYYSNGQIKEKGRARAHTKTGKWQYCDRDGINCTTKRRRGEQVRAADWKE